MRYLLAIVAAALNALTLTNASNLTPPLLPLAVRNPYFSTWLTNAREEPWSEWPVFYTANSLGLSVLVSVPSTSTVYPLLGRPHDSLNSSSTHYNISFPTYLGAQYDASTTNLSYTIPGSKQSRDEPAELTLSFLSPITPTSTLRQAIPASYLSVHVKGSFDLDLYIDVNGQWVSGNNDAKIVWSLEKFENPEGGKSLRSWKVTRKHELLFTEVEQQAEWGSLYFTAPHEAKYQSGKASKIRERFGRNGTLENKVDEKSRGILDDEPVFAFSQRFKLGGPANSTRHEVKEATSVYTLAHLQNPVVQFAAARGLTFMRPLWMSYFFTDEALLSFHYTDFDHASALAANYSAQVAHDAAKNGGDDYRDYVALSARQVIGGTSFAGTPDNPILFVKEISSNGNCQTIDIIFPAFPFFLYTNPRWLAYMLEPLIEHMMSGQYPNKYAMHDLGAHFPNMTGHPLGRDEYMPVEESGNILIMGLALINSLDHDESRAAQSIWSVEGEPKDVETLQTLSDDISPFALPSQLETRNSISGLDDQWGGSIAAKHQARKWLSRSYPIWKQWTEYLIEFSLEPENQLCTDDFAGPLKLQTNLALKGMIGIRAMSGLAELMGEDKEAKFYRNISEVYIKKWEKYAIARDGGRAKLAYHWQGSWTTLYSLYADAVLCFHPHSTESDDEKSSSNLAHGFGPQQQEPMLSGPPSQPSSHSSIFSSNLTSSNFVPDHIYRAQSRWYATVLQKYGLPLDSRHLYAKSDWEFQAAAVTSRSTRAAILSRIARWLNETVIDHPLSDLYKTEGDGGFPGPNFFARPVVGSHFAWLTLERACGGKGARAFQYEE